MIYQRTIASDITFTGIGIHSGKKVTMNLRPAAAGVGVVFKRIDLPDAIWQKADALSVGATANNTTLGTGVSAIHTVEHLLAAFYGLGINNIYCEIDGPEVPTMDGSSGSFIFVLKETGIQNLNETKQFMIITDTIRVEHEGKWAQIEPHDKLVIDSTIVFAHPVIKTQRKVFEFSSENFIEQISRARTFGMLKDVDMLKRMGLIKGGSLDNAVVLDDFNVVNPEGLRFSDEFVRHKILDTLGDISLLGYEIIGKVTTFKSGHHLHNELCKKVLGTAGSYEIVSAANLAMGARQSHILPSAIPVVN
ncbi:MAG: UDP-3-O-acyl-N-acetylglucosamine deacetylase [Bacteriovoracaceae bacterium]|nr:UDP-3-O-acyl-N-acetylglucosamine deacetylase [Bacteriovoracaceae bacterium]